MSSRKCFEFEARGTAAWKGSEASVQAVNEGKVLTAFALLLSTVGHCEGFVNITVGRCIGWIS